MCGIAGVIGRAPARDEVGAMMKALAHRGPDGEGLVVQEVGSVVATLGHRRLALLDLEGGVQPMRDTSGHALISYNGEIYGFAGLASELQRAGARLATRSDTEVIAAGFALWGDRILPRLDGMFAFAALDVRTGDVLLARDPMGIKPLYYAKLADGSIAFASELTAILAHPRAPRRIGIEGAASFFFCDFAHPPSTLIDGVHKLAPGERVWIRGGQLEAPRSYVALDDIAPVRRGDPRELERLLAEAVDKQLVADVPVGVFVSGGIDSSVVAALARRARPKQTILAFSVGFDDPSFDESEPARVVARHLGLEHFVETLDEDTLLASIDEVLASLDEPLNDHSIVPTYLLSRMAARHVKAVLSGDGADELFGGYPTYLAHGWPATIARPVLGSPLNALVSQAVGALPTSDRYQSLEWKLKRFVLRWDDDATRRHMRWMSALDVPAIRRAFGDRALTPASLQAIRVPPGRDPIAAATFVDRKTYLPGSVLTKVDRATMAHGLEARPPILDENVVRYALELRSEDKLRGREGKWLLRRAADHLLPREILARGKHGFAVPLGKWLRGPLKARLDRALDRSPAFEGPLSRSFFLEMAREHHGRRGDHYKALWAVIVLDAWMQRTGARW